MGQLCLLERNVRVSEGQEGERASSLTFSGRLSKIDLISCDFKNSSPLTLGFIIVRDGAVPVPALAQTCARQGLA